MKIFKRHIYPPIGYQTTETMFLKKLGFHQESHCGRRKVWSLGLLRGEACLPGTDVTRYWQHVRGALRVLMSKIMPWSDSLAMDSAWSLYKPKPHANILMVDLGWGRASGCFVPLNVATLYKSPFFFFSLFCVCLIGLLKTNDQALLIKASGAQLWSPVTVVAVPSLLLSRGSRQACSILCTLPTVL